MSDPDTPTTPQPSKPGGSMPRAKGESFEIDVMGSDNPAPGGAPAPGTPKIDAKPLLDVENDVCPRCHAPLAPDAVFCLKCGYDLKANVVRTPEVGVEYKPDEPKPLPEFSAEGHGNAKTMAIIGGALTVGAMITAGVFARPPTWRIELMAIALTLFQTLLHTGTGVVAVAVAAKLSEMRLGKVELAAARMLVVVATFQVITHIWFNGNPLLVKGLLGVLGALAYWVLVMLLFKRTRMEAVSVMVTHFILFAVVWLGTLLATMYNTALNAAAASSGAAG